MLDIGLARADDALVPTGFNGSERPEGILVPEGVKASKEQTNALASASSSLRLEKNIFIQRPLGFKPVDLGEPTVTEESGKNVFSWAYIGKDAAKFLRGKALCISCRTSVPGTLEIALERNEKKVGSIGYLNLGSSAACEHSFVFTFPSDEKRKVIRMNIDSAEDLEQDELSLDEDDAPKSKATETMEYPELQTARLQITAPKGVDGFRFSLGESVMTVPETPENGYYLSHEPPPHEGLDDLTDMAEVLTDNFWFRPFWLNDGQIGTGWRGLMRFLFSQEVEICAFAAANTGHQMTIYADFDGDGRADQALDESTFLPNCAYKWGDRREVSWRLVKLEKPISTKSIIFNSWADEVRLYGHAKGVASKPFVLPAAAALETKGECVRTVREVEESDKLYYGFTVEPWMFGTQLEVAKESYQPVREWRMWKPFMDDYENLNANFILMFPPKTFSGANMTGKPGGTYPTPLLWPSKVWACSQPTDWMREIADECHARGYKVFCIPRDWVFKSVEDGGSKDPQSDLAAEMMASGADGAPVCFDEQFFYNFLPGRPDTVEGRAGFVKGQLGYAEQMARIKDSQMKANPKGLTFGGFPGCHSGDPMYRYGGTDWFGFEGKLDVMGGDGTYFGVGTNGEGSYRPYIQTALQVAQTPTRLSMATVNFNWATAWSRDEKRFVNPLVYYDFPAMAHYAGALSTYFAKGKYLNFWRYNFIDYKGGPLIRKAIGDGGFMVKKLAEWGGWKAQVPKDVLVLWSTRTEDWWALRYECGKLPKGYAESDRGAVRVLPFRHFYFSTCNLCAEAAPYEIYLLNRPETWVKRAKDYKVIVLPFAYSVSKEAAAALKEAAAAGVRILAPGTYELGQADDTGLVYDQSPLAGLKAERLELNAVNGYEGSAPHLKFREQVRAALAARGGASLRIEKPLTRDIQAYMLEVSPTEKLVLVENWSEAPADFNVCMTLPKGEYRVEICGRDGVTAGAVGGRETFSASDLARLRLSLPCEGTEILRIRPAK